MALKSMKELALAAKAEWEKMTPEEREKMNAKIKEIRSVIISPPVGNEDAPNTAAIAYYKMTAWKALTEEETAALDELQKRDWSKQAPEEKAKFWKEYIEIEKRQIPTGRVVKEGPPNPEFDAMIEQVEKMLRQKKA